MGLEVPAGFEPAVIELQSIALPTWLRNHHAALQIIALQYILYQATNLFFNS